LHDEHGEADATVKADAEASMEGEEHVEAGVVAFTTEVHETSHDERGETGADVEAGAEASLKGEEQQDTAGMVSIAMEAHESSRDVQGEADADFEDGAEASTHIEENLDKAGRVAFTMEAFNSSYNVPGEVDADVEAGAEAGANTGAEAREHVGKTGEVSLAMEAPHVETDVGAGAEASATAIEQADGESPQPPHGQGHDEVDAETRDGLHKETYEQTAAEVDIEGEESVQLTPENEFVSCSDGVARCETEEEEVSKQQEVPSVAEEDLNMENEMVSMAADMTLSVGKDQLLEESSRADSAMLRLPTPGRCSMGTGGSLPN